MSDDMNSKIKKGVLWKSIEVILKKIISTVVTIILARILSPEDYGVVAITTIFITFASIFIQGGFCIAIIREPDLNKEDISTVSLLNIAFAFVLYTAIFFLAPFVSLFYKNEQLLAVLRVVAIIIIIQSYYAVPMALVTRDMNFKVLSISGTISSLTSGIVGIVLAYMGYGPWALVGQQLVLYIFDAFFITILTKYQLSLSFSRTSFSKLIRFSINTIVTSFLDFVGNNATGMLLGKFLSIEKLGYYNKGIMFPEIIGLNLYTIVNSTSLPALSAESSDKRKLADRLMNYVGSTLFIMLPIMIGLLLISDYMIPLVIGNKWSGSIPVMRYFCIVYLMNPFRALAYNTLYALGKSKVNVLFEIIRCVLLVILTYIVLVIQKSDINILAFYVAIVCMLISVCAFGFVVFYVEVNKRRLIREFLNNVLITIIMVITIVPIRFLRLQMITKLVLMIFFGAISYVLAAYITHNSYLYIVKAIVRKSKK